MARICCIFDKLCASQKCLSPQLSQTIYLIRPINIPRFSESLHWMSKFFWINLFNILSIFQHWSTTRCFELTVIIKLCGVESFCFYNWKGIEKAFFKDRVSSSTKSCQANSRCSKLELIYRTALVNLSNTEITVCFQLHSERFRGNNY